MTSDADCAAPESAADVVAYLTGQHRQIAGLLEATCRAEGGQRGEAFTQFRRLLAVHEDSEQEIWLFRIEGVAPGASVPG